MHKIIIFLFVMFVASLVLAQDEVEDYGVVSAQDNILDAVRAAEAELEGIAYSWYSLELAHCSGFVSRYLEHLGLPTKLDVTAPTAYTPLPTSPIPASSTHMQVARFELLNEEVGGGYTQVTTVETLLRRPSGWNLMGIKPGSLIYWSKAEAQIEYNGWAHVTILLGYDASQLPIFADFAAGMNNGPMLGRSLKQIADGLYWSGITRDWDLTPYDSLENPGPLRAYVVDVFGITAAALEAGIFMEMNND